MPTKNRIENKYEYPSFLRSAFAIRGSVTPKVLKLVGIAVLYALGISLLQARFLWSSIPISPFEYAGLVMGLILVFRINAGYDRWWEARKLWGTVVNNSRNLSIIVTSYTKPGEMSKLKQLLDYVAAMPYLMKNNLRQDDTAHEVEHLFDAETYQLLCKKSHKPNFVSQRIGDILNELNASKALSDFAFLQAEEARGGVIDCQGACERILKTPMPFVMAIKSRRFILLFLIIMPIALAEHTIAVNLLVTALVSYALLSLDQIGIELQNPFSKANLSHLPLDNICNTIDTNVHEMINHKKEEL